MKEEMRPMSSRSVYIHLVETDQITVEEYNFILIKKKEKKDRLREQVQEGKLNWSAVALGNQNSKYQKRARDEKRVKKWTQCFRDKGAGQGP